MAVSIVLPYYNPPENWHENVAEQYALLASRIAEPVHLILVNDGSTHGATAEQAAFIQAQIPTSLFVSYPGNKGKGYAIRQGVSRADTDIILYTDIDFPYTNDSILEIYNALKAGKADVVIGVKNEVYYDNVPPSRRFISKMLRRMIRAFFSIPTADTQCGLKGFRKNIKPIFLSTTVNRYLFDLEFIRNAYKAKHDILPIPVILKAGVQFRKVNYSILLPEVFNLVKLMFK